MSALIGSGEIGSAELLPDPTKPYEYDSTISIEHQFVPDKNVEWQLSGIKIDKNKRSAILNGTVVKEGDKINEAIVMEIGSSEIMLLHDNRRVTVKLLLSNIKRAVVVSKESDSK